VPEGSAAIDEEGESDPCGWGKVAKTEEERKPAISMDPLFGSGKL
jgi:hypothetical protein